MRILNQPFFGAESQSMVLFSNDSLLKQVQNKMTLLRFFLENLKPFYKIRN